MKNVMRKFDIVEKFQSLGPAEQQIVKNALYGHDEELTYSVVMLYLPGSSVADIGQLHSYLR